MSSMINTLLRTVMALSLVFSIAASAQDAAKEETPEPITTANAEISVEELSFLLKPLTQDELKVEVEGWIGVLKDKVTAISAAQIKALNAEGAAKEQALETVNQLQEERTVLIDRVNRAIEALRAKGGEVEVYEKYIAAVSGIDLNAKDVSSFVTVVTGWLLSAEGGLRWATNIVLFVLVLVVFHFLAKLAGKAMGKVVERARGVTNLLKNFVVNVVQKLVFFVGLIIALSMLEVNIGPFLAAIGAAGFIVGFALQGTLSNFAAGIMILLYRPYDVGDYVSVAGVSGTVEDMSLVSTTLRLPDNQIVIVPNGQIWGDVITNVTGTDKRRVDLVFGIGYDDDIQAAQDVLEDIINKHPQVLKEPAPVVRLHELADSSVNFVVRPWSKTSDYWAVYWDITRAVKERFDQADISIPYPQQDVHIRHSPNAPAAAAAPKTSAYETESGFARNDDAS
ncbi:MAG: mechanosensitive ion channel [Gammaproteobacteria bacterium]